MVGVPVLSASRWTHGQSALAFPPPSNHPPSPHPLPLPMCPPRPPPPARHQPSSLGRPYRTLVFGEHPNGSVPPRPPPRVATRLVRSQGPPTRCSQLEVHGSR